MTAQRVGIRAYARHRAEHGLSGKTDTAVRKAIADGRIEKGKDGLIDVEAADAAWGANSAREPSSPARKKKPAAKGSRSKPARRKKKEEESSGPSLTQARTAKELEQVRLARLKRLQLEGELVLRSDVASAVQGWAQRQREAWEHWPARVAAQMAAELGLKDVRSVLAVLEAHIHEQLEDLGKRDNPV